MASASSSEPEQSGLAIYVGQDRAGHWLVQDSGKHLEGRFVSRAAAISYALAEGEIYHAPVTLTPAPMTPLVPFAPVAANERVLARAA